LFGDDLLTLQTESAMAAQEDVRCQVVLLLKKGIQRILRVLLLAFHRLGKAPAKAIITMGKRNQKFLADLRTKNVLNVWQQDSNRR